DIVEIANMHPNLIVAEPTELIGTGVTSDSNYVRETIEMVAKVDPSIMVLQGAGISNGNDVYNTIKMGAMATGSTSGIIKAADPDAMVEEMLHALRKAWDEVHS
ncbi:MAG: triose-phosphate isomerase, partial [Eubacteriales bacterium]